MQHLIRVVGCACERRRIKSYSGEIDQNVAETLARAILLAVRNRRWFSMLSKQVTQQRNTIFIGIALQTTRISTENDAEYLGR
jgi:hypothetical protein